MRIARMLQWSAIGLFAACTVVSVPTTRSPTSPPPASSPTPLPTEPGTPAVYADLEEQVHVLVNRHRTSHSLTSLTYDERVAELARSHSQAMATGRRDFGHEAFDQRAAAISRFFAVGYMAENVAYDARSDVAAKAVEGWLKSSGHRKNIEGNFDVTGIGVARSSNGTFYFTQIFVERR